MILKCESGHPRRNVDGGETPRADIGKGRLIGKGNLQRRVWRHHDRFIILIHRVDELRLADERRRSLGGGRDERLKKRTHVIRHNLIHLPNSIEAINKKQT